MERFPNERGGSAPSLSSYVDDVFGGFPHDESLGRALELRRYLCEKGSSLTLNFHSKLSKTPLPARRQIILGRLYDSVARRVRTGDKKRRKYRAKIQEVLTGSYVSVKDVLKLHGYLNYAAGVAPFGKPFLAALTMATGGRDLREIVPVSSSMRSGLEIWDRILIANEGVSFDFILGQLPRCHSDVFVDASTEWGIGGHCGIYYFLFP